MIRVACTVTWVARLRATAAGEAAATAGQPSPEPLVLFRVELGAGAHTGPSGRFAHVAYEAEVHAFVLDAMGIST
jgi:oligopeptidase B